MRSIYYIVVLLAVSFFAQDVLAQTRTRRTTEDDNNSKLPELSVRAKARNENQSVNIDNVVWLRVLYRNIDLKKEANTPLYYPTEPEGDRMNLFTLMFKLIWEGRLTAYKYIDDRREVFTDQYKLDFEGMLKDSHVIYKKTGTGATATFAINDSDIPGNEVLAYMIKEAHYFDQATGTFNSEVQAICPMLISEGDFGENMRTPLFWVPYENIRPYISRSLIMTSNYNNALTYTTDDFFQMKMYQGEIIKAANMMNRTLSEQFPDSARLRYAQDSIEAQLKNFEAKLWMPKETKQVTGNAKNKTSDKTVKNEASTTKSSARASRSNTEATKKTSAPKANKASSSSSSSSSPARSVRRK